MHTGKVALSGVYFSYPGGEDVITDLSLIIPEGQTIAIVGENGAGKSTLLSLLLGIVPPRLGSVLYDGVVLSPKTVPHVRRRMGLTFQNPDDQLFMSSVREDVAFGPRNLGLGEEEIAGRVAEALDRVGIAHLRDRPPFNLSGGEKRAAAIAGVLAMRPDVLIMDEPTAGLDPKARRRIMNVLHGLGHTKIVTSHDLDMVWDVCERVVILRNGRIEADGPTPDLLRNADLLDACGLELPPQLRNCPYCGGRK